MQNYFRTRFKTALMAAERITLQLRRSLTQQNLVCWRPWLVLSDLALTAVFGACLCRNGRKAHHQDRFKSFRFCTYLRNCPFLNPGPTGKAHFLCWSFRSAHKDKFTNVRFVRNTEHLKKQNVWKAERLKSQMSQKPHVSKQTVYKAKCLLIRAVSLNFRQKAL